jgi:quercetin dioxygenase-like cupin family protein
MERNSTAFFIANENDWLPVGEGVKRQVTGYDKKLMMVKVAFEKGAVGPVHQHFHSQATLVISGKFEVSVNGQTKILHAGDTFFAHSTIFHGVVCLEKGMLVDAFSPLREEFIVNN